MLWVGVVLNSVAIALGVGVGLLLHWSLSKKLQVSLLSFLAALMIYSALRNGFYLLGQFPVLTLFKVFFTAWVCLVLSYVSFRKTSLLRVFSAFTQSAQNAMASSKPGLNNWGQSLRIGTAFFTFSPLNLIACALAGIYSQTSETWILIPFLVKALFDFIACLSFSNSLGVSALGIVIPTATSQLFLIWLFSQATAFSSNMETPMMMCSTAATLLYLCLHSAITLLGWNKSVKLLPYTPALFLTIIADLFLF